MPAVLRRPAVIICATVLLAVLLITTAFVALTDQARADVRRLGPGVTLVSAPILLGPGGALVGEGSGQSILRAAPGYTGTLVQNRDMTGVNPGNRVQGVTLDCAGRADRGLYLRGNDDLTVIDVEAKGCTGRWGIQARNILNGELLTRQTWRDVYAHHNRQGGIFNGYRTRGVIYNGITASYNGGDGFKANGSEALVTNVVAHRNGGAGVISNNIMSSTFVGVRAVGNHVGLLIWNTPQGVFEGVQAQNNRSIDIHVSKDYPDPPGYGPTIQARISGTAGRIHNNISGAGPVPGSRALVVDAGQQVDASDLIVTTG